MALAKKQKTLLVLIILAFGYIVWQLYDILGGPNISDSAALKMQAAAKKAPTTPISVPAAPVGQPVTAAAAPSQQNQQFKQIEPIQKASPEDIEASQEQSQYLRLINQYQLLKMKHMLLEEEVAIATAKQKIASLGSDASEGVENADYSVPEGTATAPFDDSGLSVVYIDFQNGRWNATISDHGRFVEVTFGSALSDGSRVVDINRKEVIVKHGEQYLRLTFGGAVPIQSTQSPTAVTPTNEDSTKIAAPTAAPTSTTQPIKPLPAKTTSSPDFSTTNTQPKTAPETTAQKKTSASASTVSQPQNIAPQAGSSAVNNLKPKGSTLSTNKIVEIAPLEEFTGSNTSATKKAPEATPTSIPLNPAEAEVYANISKLKTNKLTKSTTTSKPESMNFYTLQIMSDTNLNTINSFIKSSGITKNLYYFTIPRNGVTEYILTYGMFRTMKIANKTIETLPDSLKQKEPWIRPLATNEKLMPVVKNQPIN